MPVSALSHRCRIGSFYIFTISKLRYKSVFSPSFILYIFSILLNFLYPMKMLTLFCTSLLVSLSALGILLVLLLLLNIFLGHFLFSICSRSYVSIRNHHPLFSTFMDLTLFVMVESSVIKLMLVTFGTIERNPGPNNHLKFATWNIDSLLTRDGIKKSMIEGLDSCHKFDMFGVCETYLTKKIADEDISISGFSDKPFRADCKIGTDDEDARPRGGVCLYFKESLPIVNRSDLVLTDETIISEIRLGRNKIFHVLSYRTPSMTTVGDGLLTARI